MKFLKVVFNNFNKYEIFSLFGIYFILIVNAFLFNDSKIALVSAFCGISYTFFAGKGFPICYIFGLTGSAFYCILSFESALWGNLLLYALYYIPMQTVGFFKWNKNLKSDKKDIVKTSLSNYERWILFLITILATLIMIIILNVTRDKSPIIDGITTIFSISGMYLTVKRSIEQWFVWIIVNGLSLIMWLKIALSGTIVYATVMMWAVYFVLAIYFYFVWRKELAANKIY